MIASHFLIIVLQYYIYTVPPKLSCNGPDNQIIDVKTMLYFICSYSGSPVPHVIWTLNNSIVNTINPNITVTFSIDENSNKTSILHWVYVTPDARGTYIFTASNIYETVQSTFTILIASKYSYELHIATLSICIS